VNEPNFTGFIADVAFVITQGLLGYFALRYGTNGEEKAGYWHDNPKAEFFLLTGTAVILVVLVFMGMRVWRNFYFSDKPADAVQIHVTAQQFMWTFHYPGADGKFGRTDLNKVTATNQIGLVDDDPDGKDDIVSTNQMHIPVNKPVTIALRSKDVIHSFFLPNLRVKQDAVPGLEISITFTPNVAGNYEIACAELCGLQHYKMKGALTIDKSDADFQAWQESMLAQQNGD